MKNIAAVMLITSLVGLSALTLPPPAAAGISIGISVGIAPPPLPVYAQPIAPGPGYLWVPGYWAWSPDGYYYWVPGTWVMPPAIGLLWTPGWWGWSDGYYHWHDGYWDTQVGFYGGINYGYGYFGIGYSGGYWRNRNFHYNTAVNNINVTNIHNVYVDKTVIRNTSVNRTSYNGGTGGILAEPTPAQYSLASQHHIAATAPQINHREAVMHEPAQRFDTNRGWPAIHATPDALRPERPYMARPPSLIENSAMPPSRGDREREDRMEFNEHMREREREFDNQPERGRFEERIERGEMNGQPGRQPGHEGGFRHR